MLEQNKRLITILLFATLILLVPLIAMQLTNEVNWKVFDFIIAGVLLFGTGLFVEFTLRMVKSKQNRIVLIIILIAFLLLIWTELAVGIFNTPLAGK